MLHVKWTGKLHGLHRGSIEYVMTGAFLHGHFGQMAVGSNDGFQNDFPFLPIQAG